MALRGNVEQTAQGPDTRAAVNEMMTKLKLYPLSAAGNPSARPKLQYFNVSDKTIDRIPPEGLAFFWRKLLRASHQRRPMRLQWGL
jgi:hypothetical protein